MTSQLPSPLVPCNIDCTDLDGFMLNTEKFLASELVAVSSHEVVAAATFLWCRAWKQVPAASVPDDERVIASFARLPVKRFQRLKNEVMRGFVLCSDGRWYHTFLAQEAIRAYEKKMKFRSHRERDAERLRKWRENNGRNAVGNTDGNADETGFVREGQGQGQVSIEVESSGHALRALPQPRGTRWPADAVVSEDWMQRGELKRIDMQLPAIDLRLEAEKFTNYWSSKAGRDAVKTDWLKTWINWTLKAEPPRHGNGKAPSAHDKFFAAAAAVIGDELQREGPGDTGAPALPFGDPLLPS